MTPDEMTPGEMTPGEMTPDEMTPDEINLRPQLTPTSAIPVLPSTHPVNPTQGDGSRVKTFFILTLAAASMAVLISLLPAVGHDQLWCLYVAQRILHGTRLYGPELLETNPPLIMAALTIPAALANLLHLPVTLVFKACVLLIELASATLSLTLLRWLHPSLTLVRRWSLAFAFITIFTVLPARDFGQRDHLLALLCLPYIVAAVLRCQAENGSGAAPFSPPSEYPSLNRFQGSLRPRVRSLLFATVGVLAGLGICLKPHHILVPLAIELALVFRSRHRVASILLRPEIIALTVTGLIFVAAIRLFTPAYLAEVVPLLRDVYWAIGHLSLPQLIAESIQLHLLAGAAMALLFYVRRTCQSRNTPAPEAPNLNLPVFLMIGGAASTVAYYLQGTGWYYQQLPAISFFALAFWLLLIEAAALLHLSSPSWMPRAAAALSLLAITLTAHFSGYTLAHPLTFPSGLSNIPDPGFFTALPPDTPVAILSTVVDDTIPPVFIHHLFWAQRTNNLWALPAILRNEDPAPGRSPRRRISPTRLAELDRLQHTWMVEDLNRWRPALILVLRCQDPTVKCQILEDRHDNLLAWFERDPAFLAAFARYRYLRSSGPYDAYSLQPAAYSLPPHSLPPALLDADGRKAH